MRPPALPRCQGLLRGKGREEGEEGKKGKKGEGGGEQTPGETTGAPAASPGDAAASGTRAVGEVGGKAEGEGAVGRRKKESKVGEGLIHDGFGPCVWSSCTLRARGRGTRGVPPGVPLGMRVLGLGRGRRRWWRLARLTPAWMSSSRGRRGSARSSSGAPRSSRPSAA